MTTERRIKDEKVQFDIDREVAKVSRLSSLNIYKYEYHRGEEILSFGQIRIIEKVKFTYPVL